MDTVFKSLAVSFALAGSAAFACAGSPLIPLTALGEDAGIRVLLNARISYNDNIYQEDKDTESDTIVTIAPGFEFSTGDNGRNKVLFRFVENITYYMDETDNDRALENFDFNYSHGAQGDKLHLTTAAGFHHNQTTSSRNSATSGSMTRSFNYYANALASYKLGEKVSLRSGFKWTGLTYDNHRYQYNDRQQYAIPLYLYYAVTEKLNVGITGEWRYTDFESSGSNRSRGVKPGTQQAWFVGLAVEGDVTEKLTLKGRIGYTTSDYSDRTIDDNDGSDTLGVTLSADYKVTEKLLATLILNRDLEFDASASGIESTSVTLRGNYFINDYWSANASIDYTCDDYESSDRKDNIWAFTIGAAYAINEYAGAFVNYTYRTCESNTDGRDYENNIVTVGFSFRY